ncbi:winged helix-turn-helix transcriptional regulator [Methanoculleus sp. 10]|uniref:winged helix-turn-helix transcriptional regulator n=1 Tax=Methanoculleus sp. 10 TaxID=430615 RepID=UPI0025D6A517|nr:winged helix-turn-helix transcriptional regulator [Methanoculleus sp. 10]
MVRWGRIFSILLVAVTLTDIALPGTATAGYITKPATEECPNEMYDFEENMVQSLPLRVMISHVLLMVLPACFFPGELLYLLSALVPLGFRRVTRCTILNDDFRFDLYQRIAANPGAGAWELGELTGVSRGRLRYHLSTLIREGKVAAVGYRNRTGHFARNQRYTDLEQRIFISLREDSSRAVLGCLLGSPDTTRSDLAEHLGLFGSAISRQMQELKAGGIVTAERDGRFVRYRLSEGARDFLNRYTGGLPTPGHPGTEGYPVEKGHEVSSS